MSRTESQPAATPADIADDRLSPRISWPMFVAIIVVAAVVRILWDSAVHAVPVSDFAYYFNHGIGIVSGHGYTNGGVPTAFWPPGYPLFLAGVFAVLGKSLFAAKASSIALWTLTTALTYLLGLRLGGRPTAAIAALIVALFPDFIMFANLTASENLFVPLLTGSILALCPTGTFAAPPTWKRTAIAGALLGCSVVVRPTVVLLPFLIVAVMLALYRSKPALVASLALVAAFAVPTGVLLAYNASTVGAPVLSTSGGFSLWLGNNPRATGAYRLKGGGFPPEDISTPQKEIAYNTKYTRLAIDFVVHNPRQFVRLAPAKLRHLFDSPSSLGWNTAQNTRSDTGSYPERTFDSIEKRLVTTVSALRMNRSGWMLGLWIAGLVGIGVSIARCRTVGLWLGVLTGYWLLFHMTLANGQPRFLIPMGPAMAIGAAFAVVSATSLIKHRPTAAAK